MKAKIPGNLLTTAMAVMPHTDVSRALEMALSLDVPFWPQLPNYSYDRICMCRLPSIFRALSWMWKNEPCGFRWINSSRSWKLTSLVGPSYVFVIY
jgi:hypothetical protein